MIDERELHDIDAFFAYQVSDNEKFWRRLGGRPDFAGQRVLDFGCGHGALSLEIANAGAASVLGVDLFDQRIAYARETVAPQATRRNLAFDCADVTAMAGRDLFDCVVSKDTMEHVGPLDQVMEALVRLVRPGGAMYFGFSPLYYSPFGDHGELGVPIPWAHLLAGERRVLAAFNRTNLTAYRSLPDAGFNMRTPREFVRSFRRDDTDIRHFAINPADGLKGAVMRVFSMLSRIRPLERYVTVGIYTIIRVTKGEAAGRDEPEHERQRGRIAA
jgi:SAM-dependent methyltransferase